MGINVLNVIVVWVLVSIVAGLIIGKMMSFGSSPPHPPDANPDDKDENQDK